MNLEAKHRLLNSLIFKNRLHSRAVALAGAPRAGLCFIDSAAAYNSE